MLSETALFHYKCTEFYSPTHEQTLRWDDPALGIPWPCPTAPALGEGRPQAPRLAELPPDRLFP